MTERELLDAFDGNPFVGPYLAARAALEGMRRRVDALERETDLLRARCEAAK